MIRDSIALDYQPDSIYSASKKLKTIALKGLENLKDDADMATRNALVGSAGMRQNVNELVLAMELAINTINLLNGYVKDTSHLIQVSESYRMNPSAWEAVLKPTTDPFVPKLISQFQTTSDRDIAHARELATNIHDEVSGLVGSGIRRTRRRYGRLYGGGGSKSSGSSISGSVDTGSELSTEDEEDFENMVSAGVNISGKPISNLLNSLNSQVTKMNFFFNARIKPSLSTLESSSADDISKGMQSLLKAFNTIDTNFIIKGMEEGQMLISLLQERLTKFRIDVDIGLKTWGGIQSGEMTGSGMNLAGGARGYKVGAVFTPYPQRYQHITTKYML